MSRALYKLLWWTGLPLVAAYLLWRSLKQPEYRQHWGERFRGRGAVPAGEGPLVWLHAVSVGETRAAQPLIEALARARPDLRFVLTHMTPTGRAIGAPIAQALGPRLVQRYLPYELPSAVRQFLREVQPALGVVMETEIWPNLLAQADAARVPMLLVNARLSARSAARGARFGGLIRPAARVFRTVLAQSEADRMRIAQLYDGPIEVVGNLKFDMTPDATQVAAGRALRAGFGTRPVWLFASTREGEEALILAALARSRAQWSALSPVIVLVPRHPQRFDEVARLIASHGFTPHRRSQGPWTEAPREGVVLLGDSMGEMALYYALADVAVIGGSLLRFGAQNLIEACAVGTPVVLGPSVFNFAQAAQDALAVGAAVQVGDVDGALQTLLALSSDPARRAAMAAAAAAFSQAHRGATARTAAQLLALLPAAPATNGVTARPSAAAR